MQKITPHLWFDKEAKEAAEFYTSAFAKATADKSAFSKDSKITNVTTLHDTPSGDADVVSFMLSGYAFMAISAGPLFKFNPSISFILNFDPSRDPQAHEHLDAIWEKLAGEGKVLMELQEYPFSKRYGWVQDKYGVSWQLMLTDPKGDPRPFLIPSLMFTKEVYGKVDEAIDFYVSVFKNSKRGFTARYPAGMEPDKEGNIMFADFQLEDQWFAAMESAPEHGHNFTFNEAISLMVSCKDQKEIDYYWGKLSAVPESEQCGWLKDKYGVSWQITPAILGDMLADKDRKKVARVTEAFLKMKKFDIETLKRAYEQ